MNKPVITVLLVAAIVAGGSRSAESVMPAPSGQQFLRYGPVEEPVISSDPSVARPMGVGSLASGDDSVRILVDLDSLSSQADIYFAISAPAVSSEILLLTPAGLVPASTGLVPWMTTEGPLTTTLLRNTPVSELPPGKYSLFLAVTPAGSLSSFYLWQTEFIVGVPISVSLSGRQEVPPVNTPATGTAALAVNFDTGALSGSVLFSGLSAVSTGAGIHKGSAGINGPAIQLLAAVTEGTTGAFAVPLGSSLNQNEITSLTNNQLYINISSSANPDGEIRGQILFPPVAITTDLSGAQEVPSVEAPGGGVADIAVDVETGELSGTLTFHGLTGNASTAHIHRGVAGAKGESIVTLSVPSTAAGAANVSAMLTPEQLFLLASNELYLDIHTVSNASGELRGQIIYPPGAPPISHPSPPPPQDIQITVTLSGTQHVPPVDSGGSGTASLTFNADTGVISGSVAFSGLSSQAFGAHIHQGAAGSNGPVIVALTGGSGATSGVWELPGTALSQSQINALMADELYIEIHTANNPGGEIRGQILFP